jgi:hypothetical protein
MSNEQSFDGLLPNNGASSVINVNDESEITKDDVLIIDDQRSQMDRVVEPEIKSVSTAETPP